MLRWLIVFALSATPASAETSAADLQAWLCRIAPKAQRCRVVPLPPTKPPEPQPAPPAASKPAPAVTPPPQQAQPRATQGRQKGKPQRKVERPKTEQQPLSGGGQRLPQADAGFCFFPISCAQVCEYARAGDDRRGTPCQNARGLACVRSTCPEVLRKKK